MAEIRCNYGDKFTQTSDSNSSQSVDKNINDIDHKYLENCKIYLTDFGSNMKISDLVEDLTLFP